MSAKKIKRNVAEVSLDPPASWSAGAAGGDGSTTWTSTAAGGVVTITFLDDRDPQVHSACPQGSKVKESASGSIHVEIP